VCVIARCDFSASERVHLLINNRAMNPRYLTFNSKGNEGIGDNDNDHDNEADRGDEATTAATIATIYPLAHIAVDYSFDSREKLVAGLKNSRLRDCSIAMNFTLD